MNSLMAEDLYRGYHVGHEDGVSVSHLQFADDTLLPGEKKLGQCQIYKGGADYF